MTVAPRTAPDSPVAIHPALAAAEELALLVTRVADGLRERRPRPADLLAAIRLDLNTLELPTDGAAAGSAA